MLEGLIIYALTFWFWFHLANDSDIFAGMRAAVWPQLPAPVLYAVGCSMCSTFWVTLVLLPFTPIPFVYLFAAPPLVMLLNCGFKRLSNDQ